MIYGLVDAALLAPPNPPNPVLPWVALLAEWSELTRESPLTPVIPDATRRVVTHALDSLHELRPSLDREDSALGVPDILRLLSTLNDRSLSLGAPIEPTGVLFHGVQLVPAYTSTCVGAEHKRAFEEDVAHFSLSSSSCEDEFGVATSTDSWAHPPTIIGGQAAVLMWERNGRLEEFEPPHEHDIGLQAWCRARDLDDVFKRNLSELLMYPHLGIRLAYEEMTPAAERETHPLEYRLSATFSPSLDAMGYRQGSRVGRLKASFRAAALVASGRRDHTSLQGHLHRSGRGGTGAAIERDGARLYRGYVGNRTPNAPRIFWWDSSPPEIIAVTGHDDAPPI